MTEPLQIGDSSIIGPQAAEAGGFDDWQRL
jgi:hypothetical protein